MFRPAAITAHAAWAARAVLAWLSLAAGRRAAALARAEALCRLRPGSAWAQATRCQLLAEAGRLDEAIEAAQACARAHEGRLDRWSAPAWFNLGFLLEAQGRLAEAQAAFDQALRADPRLDRAWYGLGLVHLRAGRLDEAADALAECTRLQPLGPMAWYQLARLRAERGEHDEARRLIGHLRRFEPRVAARLVRETGLEAPAR